MPKADQSAADRGAAEAGDAADIARALGTYHEGLRNRSETALTSLRNLRLVADEVDGIFGEFAEIARELHANKKELSETRSSYKSAQKLNEDLRAKLSGSQAMVLKLEAKLDEISSERDLLERMRNELSDAHKVDQIGLKEAESRIKALEQELGTARTTIENLSEKSESLNLLTTENDKQINELREERKLLKSSVEFETAERERFSKLHEEVVTAMQSQRRALASASEELEKARSRVLHLEARQSELMGEREELTASLETAETLRETDAKNFEIRMEALASRARLAEHLLEKTRDEQRSVFKDNAAHNETQRHARKLEGEVERLTAELLQSTRRVKDLEGGEHELQAKVEELNIQIRGLKRSAEQAADKIKMQQEVVEAMHKRHAEYIEQVEVQTRKLNEQLDNERSDRTYLEGALNSARRERNAMQAQLIKLNGQGEDESVDDEQSVAEAAPEEGGAVVEELRPRSRSKGKDTSS